MTITLFYITAANEASALELGRLAVESRNAGCANVFPIQSFFPWQGAMQQENEFVLILKTVPLLAETLRNYIQESHQYDVPCIMDWNVNVNDAYGKWIESNITLPN